MIPNGVNGELRYNGVKLGKVQNLTNDSSRENLETTGIGDADAEFAYGKRTTSVSFTLLYKQDDSATVALLNRLYDDSEATDSLMILFNNGSAQGRVEGNMLLSQVSSSTGLGALASASVRVTFTGKPTVLY